MQVRIRSTNTEDYPPILNLYKQVARETGGIIRIDQEINLEFINLFIDRSLKSGLSLIAEGDSKVLGEIHAYTPEIHAFRHMLSDLTIVVHPDFHRKGIGRKLFTAFLEKVKQEFTHILRVELYVREENTGIVNFYKSLGFINEGRQKHKILNANGQLETPLHMAWFNPEYRQPPMARA